MARAGEAFLSFVVKILMIGSGMCVGPALVAAGAILQSPPTAPVPAGLVAVGVLTALSAALGFAGVRRSRALLACYLAFGSLATLAQALLVGAAFADPDRVCATISASHTNPAMAHLEAAALRTKLAAFRWIFVWVVLAEAGGLAVAAGLFVLSKPGAGWEYADMAPGDAQAAHLAAIRSVGDLKGAARRAGAGAARLAARMERRYGAAGAGGAPAGAVV